MKFLVLLLFFSAQAFALLPTPDQSELKNGMEVISFNENRFPVFDAILFIKTGYRNDPIGKSGAAKLLEKLIASSPVVQEIERLGGTLNFTLSDDAFTINVHGLSKDQNKLLSALSKIALYPVWNKKQLERIKQRVLDSWGHKQQQPRLLADLAFDRVSLSNTVYLRSGISNVRELKAVKLEDLKKFHAAWFQPQNSILMIVGRTDHEKIPGWIDSSFGQWKKAKTIKSQNQPLHSKKFRLSKNQILLTDSPGAKLAHVVMGFKGPSYKVQDYYELRLANAILGEGFNSRLTGILRNQMALTYGVQSFMQFKKEETLFKVVTSTRPQEAGKLIRVIKSVLAEFKKANITDEEFEKAKRFAIGSYSVEYSNVYSVASRWLSGYFFGLPPQFMNQHLEGIKKVKKESLVKTIQKYFSKKITVSVSGDSKTVGESLKKAKFKSVKLRSASDLDLDAVSP